MSTQVTTSPETAILDLEQAYSFRDHDVPQYLRSHPDLIPLLAEIASCVPRYFGADTQLALEVLHDPEGGPNPALYAVILTPLDSDNALARLREFDEGWWLARVPQVAGQLTVTLD